jgi:hypothetical protein
MATGTVLGEIESGGLLIEEEFLRLANEEERIGERVKERGYIRGGVRGLYTHDACTVYTRCMHCIRTMHALYTHDACTAYT